MKHLSGNQINILRKNGVGPLGEIYTYDPLKNISYKVNIKI